MSPPHSSVAVNPCCQNSAGNCGAGERLTWRTCVGFVAHDAMPFEISIERGTCRRMTAYR